MELKNKVGSFELRQEEVTREQVEALMETVKQDFKDGGRIEDLIEHGDPAFDLCADFNTVVYYDYVAENTLGGAVFINLEPYDVNEGDANNPPSVEYFLTLYAEYDGHVEDYGQFDDTALELAVNELYTVMAKEEKEFKKLDEQGRYGHLAK